jgi:hypothetical protein
MLSQVRSSVGLGVVIVLTLAGCGGGPDSSSPGEVSRALLGDPRVLTLNISGQGTVTGSYTTGSGDIAIFGAGCSAAVCTATVPEGASVTLTGAGSNFIGFQRPYCDVNTCNWDDPEFAPPTQYVWAKAAWTFVLGGAKTVIAKFGAATAPAPSTYALSLALSGAGTVSVSYAVGTAVTNLSSCSSAACSYSIPVNAAVTLAGGANFLGFQRPYCDVNPCDSTDPECAPPQQYAWSTAPWTFALDAPKAVNAKFGTLLASPPATVALTVNINGTGTIAASYAVGASVTTLGACNQPTCAYNIPVSASVTLSGGGTTFAGFQRPYCDVNTCNWNDPEFAPPTQYVWSKAAWTFVLSGAKTVIAKFTPPPPPVGPTYLLTLYVSGTGTVSVSYAAGTAVTPLTPCGAACTYQIPTYASVTIAAASGSFMGFQRPYCDVNPCNWDDPEWMPPTPNAWSTAPWTLVLAAPKSVNAKFAP